MSKKKRIIISNYDDCRNPWYAGGGAVAIHKLASFLVGEFDVLVLTGMYPGASRHERIDGVEYRRVGCSVLGPRLGQLVYSTLLVIEAFRLRYDLWIDSFTPPFGVSLLPLVDRKKMVGVIHMLPGKDMWRKYHIPFHVIERFGLRWYRRILTLSKSSRAEIAPFLAGDAVVDVIPNGIDISSAKPLGIHEKRHVLYIGRIEIDQKGIDLLLSAYDRIAEDVSYPLIIAGSGIASEEEKLRSLIGGLKHRDRVSMVGRVSGGQKDRLFREAAVIVVSSRFETFSITALEALSYGVPVVAFDIPGISAVPDCYVKKVAPFSVDGLAQSMRSVITSLPDPESVQETVRGYSWEAVCKQYREFIRAII